MIISYKTADEKVAKLQQQGHDIEWEGWDLILYRPDQNGFMRKNGAFRNGQWCLSKRFKPNEQGKWVLPGVKIN